MPVPAIVNPTEVAAPFSIIPEKDVTVLTAPAVRTIAPPELLVIKPDPAKVPMVSLDPPKSKMPLTVTALVLDILVPVPILRVPVVMIVGPV